MCLCSLFAFYRKLFRSDYGCYDLILILQIISILPPPPMLTRFKLRALALSRNRTLCSWIFNDFVTLCESIAPILHGQKCTTHDYAVDLYWQLHGKSQNFIFMLGSRTQQSFSPLVNNPITMRSISTVWWGKCIRFCRANFTKRVHFDSTVYHGIRCSNMKCTCILISRKITCIEYIWLWEISYFALNW